MTPAIENERVKPDAAAYSVPARWFATIISFIFHPVFIPVYVTLFVLYGHQLLFAGYTDQMKTRLVATSVSSFSCFLYMPPSFRGRYKIWGNRGYPVCVLLYSHHTYFSCCNHTAFYFIYDLQGDDRRMAPAQAHCQNHVAYLAICVYLRGACVYDDKSLLLKLRRIPKQFFKINYLVIRHFNIFFFQSSLHLPRAKMILPGKHAIPVHHPMCGNS